MPITQNMRADRTTNLRDFIYDSFTVGPRVTSKIPLEKCWSAKSKTYTLNYNDAKKYNHINYRLFAIPMPETPYRIV